MFLIRSSDGNRSINCVGVFLIHVYLNKKRTCGIGACSKLPCPDTGSFHPPVWDKIRHFRMAKKNAGDNRALDITKKNKRNNTEREIFATWCLCGLTVDFLDLRHCGWAGEQDNGAWRRVCEDILFSVKFLYRMEISAVVWRDASSLTSCLYLSVWHPSETLSGWQWLLWRKPGPRAWRRLPSAPRKGLSASQWGQRLGRRSYKLWKKDTKSFMKWRLLDRKQAMMWEPQRLHMKHESNKYEQNNGEGLTLM